MLDIRFIRENRGVVQKAIRDKGVDLDFERLLEVDGTYRTTLKEVEEWRNERNEISKKIADTEGEERRTMIESMRQKKDAMAGKEARLKEVEKELRELLLKTPNIPWSGTPVGPDAESNKEIKKVGTPRNFDFDSLDHGVLGERLGFIDFDEGVKISGFRGYVLKNEGALLHWAVLQLAFQKMVSRGFTPIVPPALIKEFALYGSGHFPFGRKEVFELKRASRDDEEQGESMYLAGTSEPSLLATKADVILREDDLPVKLFALTSCYRSEVGAYGKDAKGLYRVHEFAKVEQVVMCRPDMQEAQKWFDAMLGIAEEMLTDLELPYRTIETSTGDMGAGKYRMIDIETWMPSRGAYGETHSCSNLTDWQARRLNIRFRDSNNEVRYPFTLNNTVIASPRILIPLIENHQQSDGSIRIPKALQPFMNGRSAIAYPRNVCE